MNPLTPDGTHETGVTISYGDHRCSLRELAAQSPVGEIRALEVSTKLTDDDLRWLSTAPLDGLRHLALLRVDRPFEDLSPVIRALARGPLASLDLTTNNLGDAAVEAMCETVDFAALRALAIGMNRLTDRALLALSNAPWTRSLERLSIGDRLLRQPAVGASSPRVVEGRHNCAVPQFFPQPNEFGPAGLEAIASEARLPALRELDLWAVTLREGSLAALARSGLTRRLRHLGLRGLTLAQHDVDAMCEALRESTCAVESVEVEVVEPLSAQLKLLTAVASVRLECEGLRVAATSRIAAIEAVETLAVMPSLRAFESDCRLQGQHASALCNALRRSTRLHDLALELDGDAVPALLEGLDARGGDPLRRLRLRLHDSAHTLAVLANWSGLGALSQLHIASADLRDAHAVALLDAPRLCPLEDLSLRDGVLTRVTIDRLLSAPCAPTLRRLDLRGNSLPFDALAHLIDGLSSLARLESLELFGNSVDWSYHEWTDWDGSVTGVDVIAKDEVRALLRRVPSSIHIYVHDPR